MSRISNLVLHHADGGFDFTALQHSSKQAVNKYIVTQILHELEWLVSKLSQLSEWLKEAYLLTNATDDIWSMETVKIHINTVTQQLSYILVEVNGAI